MLCHFGQTRSDYVTSYFFLLNSTAAGSATSDYVVVPEHNGQKEEAASSNEERTGKKPSFVPKVDLFEAIVFPSMYLMCSMKFLWYFF